MPTSRNNTQEQTNTEASVSNAGNNTGLAALLDAAINDPLNGLRLRGVVTNMGEERTFEGSDPKGNKWSKTVKAFEVAVPGRTIVVNFDKNAEGGIPDISYGSIITVDVEYATAKAGKISVSGKLAA